LLACASAKSAMHRAQPLRGRSHLAVQRLSEADKCAHQVLWRRKILPDDCFEEIKFARQSMHKIKAS
jgi:hypothetical protein